LSRRIDARELLAALGGLLVLISLFLEWYDPGADAAFRGNGITGWEAFEAIDLVLAALALAVIATGAQALGTVGSLGGRALLPLGALLLIIVVVQIASPPPVSRTGVLVGDGICQTRVPTAWVEESPGNGTTPGRNRFVVYGNRLSGDAAWTNAVTLFTEQVERAGATVESGEGWVRAIYPDGRGFAYRARFADRWCDVRLTARSGALPDGEALAWEAIVANLEPAA